MAPEAGLRQMLEPVDGDKWSFGDHAVAWLASSRSSVPVGRSPLLPLQERTTRAIDARPTAVIILLAQNQSAFSRPRRSDDAPPAGAWCDGSAQDGCCRNNRILWSVRIPPMVDSCRSSPTVTCCQYWPLRTGSTAFDLRNSEWHSVPVFDLRRNAPGDPAK